MRMISINTLQSSLWLSSDSGWRFSFVNCCSISFSSVRESDASVEVKKDTPAGKVVGSQYKCFEKQREINGETDRKCFKIV